MTRGLAKPEGDVIAFDCPAASRPDRTSRPSNRPCAPTPPTSPPLVEEAAVFEQNKLEANALAAYRKVAARVERRRLGARPDLRTGRIAGHAGRAQGRRDLARRQNLRPDDRHLEIPEAAAGSLAAVRRCRRQNLQPAPRQRPRRRRSRRTRWSSSPTKRPLPPRCAMPSRPS